MDWLDEISRAWQREYPDLDTSVMPPLVRIARVGVLIDAFQHEVVAPFDLAPSDYAVLAALRRAGAPYELSPSRLTIRLQRSSGGMTKMLKRLQERGLIKRIPDPEDGRGSLVRLTRRGIALQEEIFRAFLEASDQLIGSSSRDERAEIDSAARTLIERLEKHLHA